jgi:hypothetical protein
MWKSTGASLCSRGLAADEQCKYLVRAGEISWTIRRIRFQNSSSCRGGRSIGGRQGFIERIRNPTDERQVFVRPAPVRHVRRPRPPSRPHRRSRRCGCPTGKAPHPARMTRCRSPVHSRGRCQDGLERKQDMPPEKIARASFRHPPGSRSESSAPSGAAAAVADVRVAASRHVELGVTPSGLHRRRASRATRSAMLRRSRIYAANLNAPEISSRVASPPYHHPMRRRTTTTISSPIRILIVAAQIARQ